MSNTTKKLGNAGENLAATFLENHGYKILEKNYRIRTAEIDIIAEKDSVIIFVEVKTRSNIRKGTPAEAVNLRKQKKIIEAASVFLQDENFCDCACRFDVIEIISTGKDFKINHIENAFEVVSEY
ncbi:MAG: YraN family protein [Selenomonadaceae bacterium]|nr:YraN family protein [Selenomonadaceae bacterium]